MHEYVHIIITIKDDCDVRWYTLEMHYPDGWVWKTVFADLMSACYIKFVIDLFAEAIGIKDT